MYHIGSGICLTMICSDICQILNKTDTCHTTTQPTPEPTPTSSVPSCPEWDVVVRIFLFFTITIKAAYLNPFILHFENIIYIIFICFFLAPAQLLKFSNAFLSY